MPTVKVEVELSPEELLKAVEQLSQQDLERFVSSAIALRAQRRETTLPRPEAELLQKINRGISPDTQKRYDELIAKRQAETLTDDEHRELLELSEQVELLEAQRLEYLAELARLRGISLIELMENLGIQTPAYV